ncbi:MAG: hypothetical protein QOJ59_4129 [Thermomicrobiales bacterium]|jgi:hypothetical protein|nr:hypothetical protein [Thermomicrobiales bacterium]
MVATRKPITVSDESNLTELLDEAAVEPVLLEKNGVLYRLSVATDTDDLWSNYDPERLRATVLRMAGSISPEEGERIKALIYRGREEGTRPIDRP